MSFSECTFPNYTNPDRQFPKFGTGFYIKVRFKALTPTFINLKPTPEGWIPNWGKPRNFPWGVGKHIFGNKTIFQLCLPSWYSNTITTFYILYKFKALEACIILPSSIEWVSPWHHHSCVTSTKSSLRLQVGYPWVDTLKEKLEEQICC